MIFYISFFLKNKYEVSHSGFSDLTAQDSISDSGSEAGAPVTNLAKSFQEESEDSTNYKNFADGAGAPTPSTKTAVEKDEKGKAAEEPNQFITPVMNTLDSSPID